MLFSGLEVKKGANGAGHQLEKGSGSGVERGEHSGDDVLHFQHTGETGNSHSPKQRKQQAILEFLQHLLGIHPLRIN